MAPVHLLDPESGAYNTPFLPPGVRLVRGYLRRQGICHRPGDARFEGKTVPNAVESALADPRCRIQSRNRGSGTRVLIDELLAGRTPPGSTSESRSHHAVAAAVAQGRADWGICLETVASAAARSCVNTTLAYSMSRHRDHNTSSVLRRIPSLTSSPRTRL